MHESRSRGGQAGQHLSAYMWTGSMHESTELSCSTYGYVKQPYVMQQGLVSYTCLYTQELGLEIDLVRVLRGFLDYTAVSTGVQKGQVWRAELG